jgi:hypothetical protein
MLVRRESGQLIIYEVMQAPFLAASDAGYTTATDSRVDQSMAFLLFPGRTPYMKGQVPLFESRGLLELEVSVDELQIELELADAPAVRLRR